MSTSDWIALGELAVAIVDKTNIFIFKEEPKDLQEGEIWVQIEEE